MSLFISSSKYRHSGIPVLMGLAMLVVLNALVFLLPDGVYKRQFAASVQMSRDVGDNAKVVIFGDSRATMFHPEFFHEKTFSFASPNNTVIFSKMLFDKMISETKARPRVMIIVLGANDYNKNGIFTKRDFAIRQLASFSDILDFATHPGGYGYMIDAVFAKMFPVYGRRMEIRSPSMLRFLFTLAKRPLSETDIHGMGALDRLQMEQAPERSAIDDHNYWLIYKRSIYRDYELSLLHTGLLESLIDNGIKNGATVITVQLPVEPKIRELENQMVGKIFDNYLVELKAQKSILHLDLRDDMRFEFQDLNHLSLRGARELSRIIFKPIIAETMGR